VAQDVLRKAGGVNDVSAARSCSGVISVKSDDDKDSAGTDEQNPPRRSHMEHARLQLLYATLKTLRLSPSLLLLAIPIDLLVVRFVVKAKVAASHDFMNGLDRDRMITSTLTRCRRAVASSNVMVDGSSVMTTLRASPASRAASSMIHMAVF
jgi:hypothetical protein